MTIGSLEYRNMTDGQGVVVLSPRSSWATIISAGGLATQDAASITNPTAEITDSTRSLMKLVSRGGSYLQLMAGYDDGLSSITDPIIKVFGRANATDKWQLLQNTAGSITATLTTAATDVTDGTLKYTTPDHVNHVWFLAGCQEILVGVQTVLAGTGVTNNSILLGKVF